MATHSVIDWLAAGVPLTLLCDLLDPAGPDSTEILAVERPTSDPVWREAARPHVVPEAAAG